MIPIIIVCYNNHKYVENTLVQILKINPEYYNQIIIMDNLSTDAETIQFLRDKEDSVKVIYNDTNNGPRVNTSCNQHVYDKMPDKFILTDPDLEFNENLPSNFIEILSELSDKYNSHKIGFALRIDDFEDMFPSKTYAFCAILRLHQNIYEWESKFWTKKLPDENFELYEADIDTTFALVNKKISPGFHIRVAGNFMARHLPWYINKHDILNIDEKCKLYRSQSKISTISKTSWEYLKDMTHIKSESPNMIYFIVTTCLYKDFEIREKQYSIGINKLKKVIRSLNIENYKIIIVENNGFRATFLDKFDCDVQYTNNNLLPLKNGGHKELLDILDCINNFNINDNDFIVKMTGRYILEDDSSFMNIIKNLRVNPYDCVVKIGSYLNPVNYRINDCIIGLIGMKCSYIKQIEAPYETDNFCEPIEYKWAKAIHLIASKNTCIIQNKMGILMCPGSNFYFSI